MAHLNFRYFASTIGRKQLVAVTGLGLSGFVLTHMLGNMLMFVSPEAYNNYGHALTSNPLIYLAEAALIGLFFGHLIVALVLTWRNRQARPQKYAVKAAGEKGTDFISQSMWAQGLLIFAFLVFHLITFKFGTFYEVDYGSGPIRDLHQLMIEVFSQPSYISWYVICLIVLGLHLSHGIKSSLQTLGLSHPKYDAKVKCASLLYAVVVAGGFLSQPLYIFLFER